MSNFGYRNGISTGATIEHDSDKSSWNNNFSYEAQRENIKNTFNYQSIDYEWPVFSPYRDLY